MKNIVSLFLVLAMLFFYLCTNAFRSSFFDKTFITLVVVLFVVWTFFNREKWNLRKLISQVKIFELVVLLLGALIGLLMVFYVFKNPDFFDSEKYLLYLDFSLQNSWLWAYLFVQTLVQELLFRTIVYDKLLKYGQSKAYWASILSTTFLSLGFLLFNSLLAVVNTMNYRKNRNIFATIVLNFFYQITIIISIIIIKRYI